MIADAALAGPPRSVETAVILQAVTLAATPLLLPHGLYYPLPISAGLLTAAFLAGARLGPAATLRAFAVTAAAMACHLRVRHAHWVLDHPVPVTAFTLMITVIPWLGGRLNATYQDRLSQMAVLAERREHDERVALHHAVAEERRAIARDLHDVISHHVSAIGIHAGVARMELAGSPADAPLRRSVSEMETASRSAQAELRRLLDVLHGQAPSPGRHQPGMADVSSLLERVRAAGLNIDLDAPDGLPELPESRDIALYRILQEALTNALRHGDGGTARVALHQRPEGIALTVTNPFRKPYTPGRGLIGIRQRVELLGGTVRCGPDEDGAHWRLAVTYPWDEE
ncbi:histidine kinase [Actinocorallia lasiicapitis]